MQGAISCWRYYRFLGHEDNFYWPEAHMKILDRFIDLKEQGVEVKYISGNHDDPLREDRILRRSL